MDRVLSYRMRHLKIARDALQLPDVKARAARPVEATPGVLQARSRLRVHTLLRERHRRVPTLAAILQGVLATTPSGVPQALVRPPLGLQALAFFSSVCVAATVQNESVEAY